MFLTIHSCILKKTPKESRLKEKNLPVVSGLQDQPLTDLEKITSAFIFIIVSVGSLVCLKHPSDNCCTAES